MYFSSKFCGESVCADELVKERADPQNPKLFYPICKICERKYIEKIIKQEKTKKQQAQDLEIELLTKKLSGVEKLLKEKKNENEEIQRNVKFPKI